MSDHADTAKAFHEAYERLAPSFGYETRKESAVPWEDIPENNRALMTAVCGEVVGAIVAERDEALARVAALTEALETIWRMHDIPIGGGSYSASMREVARAALAAGEET